MKNTASIFRALTLLVLISLLGSIQHVYAQSEPDLGLCPEGYEQGLISTGFVDCYDTTRATSQREDAEFDRLQLEAVCDTVPNSEVTNSEILVTGSGRFFAEVTCTIARPIPAGTILCPDDSEEVLRAFDTLVCKYFGNTVATVAEGQAIITAQTAECATFPNGRVLKSGIGEGTILEDTSFFFTSLACAIEIDALDVIECPYSFDEISRDENELICSSRADEFETEEEATQENMEARNICTSTTAGLGSVPEFIIGRSTSNELFFSNVECLVRIPRYADFEDASVVRACDASCTEEIEQSRNCVNGGTVGGPGCVESDTQIIERRCNTGTNADGLCPLILAPSTVVPLLLDDEED